MCATIAPTAAWAVDSFAPSVEITGRHVVENNLSLQTGRHTFVLTADDNAPMPTGSSAGVKEVTISSNESFSFGPISYSEPGNYSYTVSRNVSQSKNLVMDDAKYRCTVEVYADGTAVVVFEKQGTVGKPNTITYTDTYVATPTPTPQKSNATPEQAAALIRQQLLQTGDELFRIVVPIFFVSSTVLLVVIALRKRRHYQNE